MLWPHFMMTMTTTKVKMDGDFDSGMTSAGFGTDEDYGG